MGIADWANIPPELQALNQWAVAGPDKAPQVVTGDTVYRTSVTEGPWMSFADACKYAEANNYAIGFILTASDPYACVDMDVKDRTCLDKNGQTLLQPQWTTREDTDHYMNFIRIAESYSERSYSGQGVHTWFRSGVGRGRRNKRWELYDRERFIICTGLAVRNVRWLVQDGYAAIMVQEDGVHPLVPRQNLIDSLITEIGAAGDEDFVELVEEDERYPDADIMRVATNSANGEKFTRLYSGDISGYPSHSEADHALIEHLCFLSDSNEQVRRMFLASKLGQREKHKKHKGYHVELSLKKIRTILLVDKRSAERELKIFDDRMGDTINRLIDNAIAAQVKPVAAKVEYTSGAEVAAQIAQETSERLTRLASPSTAVFPTEVNGGELEWPPGLVGELALFIYNSSFKPVKEISIASAIGYMAGIAGLCYQLPTNTGLNIYLLVVARSGVGKEAMSSGLNFILHNMKRSFVGDEFSMEPGAGAVEQFVSFESSRSAPALVKQVLQRRSFINMQTEFGRKIQSAGDTTNNHVKELFSVLLDLYNKSGEHDTFGGVNYSDKEKNIESSKGGVSYSLLGESTPGVFEDSLTPAMMEDGSLSRFSVIRYDGPRPVSNRNQVKEMDEVLHAKLTQITHECIKNVSRHHFEYVIFEDEVLDEQHRFETFVNSQINKADDDESIRQMWNRAEIKINRLAALLAVGDKGVNAAPVVTIAHYKWAHALVMSDIVYMTKRIETGHIITSNLHALREDTVLNIIKDIATNGPNRSDHIPRAMIADGYITQRSIKNKIRRLKSFTSERRSYSELLDSVLVQLIKQGTIIEVPKVDLMEYRYNGRAFQVAFDME